MLQTWRWFGPDDPVSLNNVRQAGAVGVVSALHHMNQGQVWSEDEVAKRRAEIEAGGLVWPVVESIGVGEEIKTRSCDYRAKIDNYKQSIRNASRAGVKTFCYNFMAITDWTRTNLNWPLSNGGTALRFDAVDFAAYASSSSGVKTRGRLCADRVAARERWSDDVCRRRVSADAHDGSARDFTDREALGAFGNLGRDRRRPAPTLIEFVREIVVAGGGRAPRRPS